jgi:hypothetical protein
MISFVDDFSRYTMLHLLSHKDEAFNAYKKYEKLLETQFGVKIKYLHTDRGGEFLSKEFTAHLEAAGTMRNLTVHDTPEHNGIAERLNRTLLERVRAMLHAKDLPKNLWGMAVRHAVWLKNRTPTKVGDEIFVPYELWNGKKPNLKGLREFGSTVWVNDEGTKLDGRGYDGIWLGFDSESSGSHIYWPNRSMTVERSFKFEKPTQDTGLTGVRNERESEDSVPPTSSPETPNSQASTSQQPPQASNPQEITPTPTPRPSSPITTNNTDHLGDSFQTAPPNRPKRQRKEAQKLKDIRSGAGVASSRPSDPRFAPGVQTSDSTPEEVTEGAFTVEPFRGNLEPSYEEAKKGPEWKSWLLALTKEYDTLVANGTWDIVPVPRPEGTNVVDCKWALRVKLNSASEFEKLNARLVAKGFTQVEGVDYFERYAPVAKPVAIRIILSIANRGDWDINQFDFHAAFLNASLDEDEVIYMEQPPDFETADHKKFVLRLRKTIYGLKQSARKWYQLLPKSLATLSFSALETDNAVYVKRDPPHITILAIHVDDTTITGSSTSLIREYQEAISRLFKVTLLGPVSWLLWIQITRDRKNRTLSLSQHAYAAAALDAFNMVEAKGQLMPLAPGTLLTRNTGSASAEVPYRRLVGKLMWLIVATRPDLAYAVTILSQFNNNPTYEHWEATKGVLRYLKETLSYKLTFDARKDSGLEGYCDADGMTQEGRQAFSGYAFLIDGGAVSWSSRKQELVSCPQLKLSISR